LRNIVWLASYPKSGNTWFRILLDNYFSSSPDPVDINSLQHSRSSSSRELFDQNTAINSSDLTKDEIDCIRPDIYEKISSDHENLVFFKVHDAWSRNSNGRSLFPPNVTKGVIYLIRNPLEIAVSYTYHTNSSFEQSVQEINDPNHAFATNPHKLSFQLKQTILDWSGHVHSWVEESGLPLCVIRYEDLLKNPLKEFIRALDFLELKPNIAQANKAVINSQLEILQAQEIHSGFQEKPMKAKVFFRNGQNENWQSELDLKLINEIIKTNKTVMQLYGYY